MTAEHPALSVVRAQTLQVYPFGSQARERFASWAEGQQHTGGFSPTALKCALRPRDGDPLRALEMRKQVTKILCFSHLFAKASGHFFSDSQRWQANYSWAHFHLPSSLPNSDQFMHNKFMVDSCSTVLSFIKRS